MGAHRARRVRGVLLGAGLACVFTLAGCVVDSKNAQVSDTWERSYPLTGTGEVRITNANGGIEIAGTDAQTVEIRAERIAHGASDQVARDLLPRITIKEDIRPDSVVLETEKVQGILLGASFEVRYHVKAPRGATVRATTANGAVDVQSLAGRVTVQAVNGAVSASAIRGSLDLRTVNGPAKVELDAVGEGTLAVTTVNGGITLGLPSTIKTTVTATWLNGGIDTSGLPFEVVDQGRRRFEGRLNGGGTPIDLRTTNGGIVIAAR